MMTVKLQNLSVNYGSLKALNNINLEIPDGATGLLGINGAGKTSLLKAILGLVNYDAKLARVLDIDILERGKAIRQLIGYMPENDCLIPGFNGIKMVQYAGELCGMSGVDAMQRAHEVLFYVGLEEARYRNVETYSSGMKQRIKLAQAIVHDPKLLFLDEPTNGMDPKGREEMLNLIRDISRRKQISVILCSHILFDVERTCENVIILHQGNVIKQGRIAELKGKHANSYTVRIAGDHEKFERYLLIHQCTVAQNGKNHLDIHLPDKQGTQLLITAALETGVQLRELTASIQSLEDVFVKLIGEKIHADL